MNEVDWNGVIFGMGFIVLSFIVAIVVIWQIFATARARMSVAREEAYRRLAEEATVVQRRAADGLERTATELAELRARTAELERMMKEVG